MHHLCIGSFWFKKIFQPPAGLEPAIPGLGGRCLIHWATEARVAGCLCSKDCLLSTLPFVFNSPKCWICCLSYWGYSRWISSICTWVYSGYFAKSYNHTWGHCIYRCVLSWLFYSSEERKKLLTPTWFEHATFWSGVRRATVAPRSPLHPLANVFSYIKSCTALHQEHHVCMWHVIM